MPIPFKHKTVQARIFKYTEVISLVVMPREEAERQCGFNLDAPPADQAKESLLLFVC